MIKFGRPLPPELHSEIHKCLPLANAIYVLVNVPSRVIAFNNSPRMRRCIQRLKTSLNEYIEKLATDENEMARNEEEEIENDEEVLKICKEIEWKPQLDALFRYGACITTTKEFVMEKTISGVPKNFAGELFLHLANSRSTQMMLDYVEMYFDFEVLPIPTFLKPLFEIADEDNLIDGRILFDSLQLEIENGQFFCIYEGELSRNKFDGYEFILNVVNKMDKEMLFQIKFCVDSSKEFIHFLEYTKWEMQSLDDFVNSLLADDPIEQCGDKFEAKKNIYWDTELDLWLRRGAGLSTLRHFKLNQQYNFNLRFYNCNIDYIDFLISYMANTKYPEEFLESIEMNLEPKIRYSLLIYGYILKICLEGIPQGGIITNFHKKNLHILSAKIVEPKKQWLDSPYDMEFTLANIPTNGKYLFDIDLQIGNQLNQILGITIKKRKIENIVELELECNDQIGLGKKRKATNYDDGKDENIPSYSGKITRF